MNLAELLTYADIGQIHKIIDSYQCQCDRHSKTEMIQQLIFTVFNNKNLQNFFLELTETEYIYLQLLYLDSKNKYTIEDLLAKGKQAVALTNSTAKPRELVLTALKNGWIFTGVGSQHKLTYLVPQDFRDKVLQLLKELILPALRIKNVISYYREESNLAVGDLGNLLKHLQEEEVMLTNEGYIYKRQLQGILKKLLVNEEPVKVLAWRFGYGRRYNEYPDRFSLLYDYAYYHNLLIEDQRGYLLVTPKGEKLLNNPRNPEMDFKLYQFWVRLYKNTIPYLQHVLRLIDLVAESNWIEINSLEKQLLVWINQHYYETKEQVFRERIVKMLVHLGAAQIGNESNSTYLRLTDAGHTWINGFDNFTVKKIELQ